MPASPARLSGLVLAASLLAAPTQAAVEARTGTFGGLEVDYRVVLPEPYDPQAAYPVVLHFVGGPQTIEIVESSLAADWVRLAEERGVVVVSPASPDGRLFFQGAETVLPDLLDHIFDEFDVEGGKLHLTGHSNGGISAFHAAALHADRVRSVTGYPGYLIDATPERLAALAPLCLYLHVGDRDPGWLASMEAQAARFEALGYRVRFTVEPDQIHRLDTSRDELAERIFDELAASRTDCP